VCVCVCVCVCVQRARGGEGGRRFEGARARARRRPRPAERPPQISPVCPRAPAVAHDHRGNKTAPPPKKREKKTHEADVRVPPGAQPARQLAADLQPPPRLERRRGQRLRVGVDDVKLHALEVGGEHAVDGVGAAAADADDLGGGGVFGWGEGGGGGFGGESGLETATDVRRARLKAAAAQPKPGFRELPLSRRASSRATVGACTPRRQRTNAAHPVSGPDLRGSRARPPLGGPRERKRERVPLGQRATASLISRLTRPRHRTETPQSTSRHASHLDRGAVKVAAGQRRHGLDGRGAGARARDRRGGGGSSSSSGRAARGGRGARGVRAESHGLF
jgi:hypothetical protein